jgi:hypothetical protein
MFIGRAKIFWQEADTSPELGYAWFYYLRELALHSSLRGEEMAYRRMFLAVMAYALF